MTPWLGRPTSAASGYISARRTVPSPATSQSLTWLLSSPPTYWTGLPTWESRGSSRSKSDSTGIRGPFTGETRTPSSLAATSQTGEPDGDLAVRRLRGVRAVDEVLLHGAAPVPGEVAADGARQGLRRVGRTHERSPAVDHPLTLGDGGDHGTGGHERHERFVERLAYVLGVVLLEQV